MISLGCYTLSKYSCLIHLARLFMVVYGQVIFLFFFFSSFFPFPPFLPPFSFYSLFLLVVSVEKKIPYSIKRQSKGFIKRLFLVVFNQLNLYLAGLVSQVNRELQCLLQSSGCWHPSRLSNHGYKPVQQLYRF